MTLKEIIRRERIKRKLRQQDLAELIGRSQTNISAIERGEMPKFDIACMLCDIFGLKPTKVWEDIKSKYNIGEIKRPPPLEEEQDMQR